MASILVLTGHWYTMCFDVSSCIEVCYYTFMATELLILVHMLQMSCSDLSI